MKINERKKFLAFFSCSYAIHRTHITTTQIAKRTKLLSLRSSLNIFLSLFKTFFYCLFAAFLYFIASFVIAAYVFQLFSFNAAFIMFMMIVVRLLHETIAEKSSLSVVVSLYFLHQQFFSLRLFVSLSWLAGIQPTSAYVYNIQIDD